jgi:hypothetical protein
LLLQNLPGYRQLSVLKRFKRSQVVNDEFRKSRHLYALSDRHISNLKIVTDRTTLLEFMPKGGHVVEIGVAAGDFSASILEVTQPVRLYLIDPWESGRYKDLHKGVMARFSGDSRVSILRGYSTERAADIPDGSLDWAYVDGDHSFKGVSTDLALLLPKMKPNGIIAGDDYTRWSGNGLHRWGVVEAVNRFCLDNNWEMIFLTHEPGRHLSYAIRRMKIDL